MEALIQMDQAYAREETNILRQLQATMLCDPGVVTAMTDHILKNINP
jgi:hypothetical protein